MVLSPTFSSPKHNGRQCIVNIPCKFPKTTSVRRRSPIIHNCQGCIIWLLLESVEVESISEKCLITSSRTRPPKRFNSIYYRPHNYQVYQDLHLLALINENIPGFFSLCRITGIPKASSVCNASFISLSYPIVPAELLKIATF